MSSQNQQVFQHCVALAKELEAADRGDEAVSVLRALQVYLDALPAFPDGSCANTTAGLLDRMSARLREKDRSNKSLGRM